ncbi:unnamed protein product [Darwinula stevensoni]|uniref:Uncharacterized protein n=1 Tax=Darwinula stevensoni TaxID=69355 RepID=A0A7R8X8D1_9CRUS|nr:unnamed protein product [Darwinula stevensoni]CAG0888628.1 unnamed protein product [Darwinula stevensoni]
MEQILFDSVEHRTSLSAFGQACSPPAAPWNQRVLVIVLVEIAALCIDDSNCDYYIKRSYANLKLDKFTESKRDAEAAINLSPDNPKAFLRKAITCFHLGEYKEALKSFETVLRIDESTPGIRQWITWCKERLDRSKKDLSPVIQENEAELKAYAMASVEDIGDAPLPATPGGSTGKVKHDWYQTQTHVIVTVMLKGISKDDLKVHVTETTLSVTALLPNGNEYSLELDLAHPILDSDCVTKILPSKVEIKLKKRDDIFWAALEGDGTPALKPASLTSQSCASDSKREYPSSSKHKHDWDALAAEVAKSENEEQGEGEAGLNQLFQKIYSQGSDEVRKAMNKSYYESGGTVLSTNWNDISQKKVEVKPPDGMEFKTWEK